MTAGQLPAAPNELGDWFHIVPLLVAQAVVGFGDVVEFAVGLKKTTKHRVHDNANTVTLRMLFAIIMNLCCVASSEV